MSGYRAKPPMGALLNRGDPLAKGLVGAWLFNEGSGLKAYDSARINHGTLTGGPTWAGGAFGKCLSYNGSTAYVNLGNPAALDLTVYTIALSVYPTDTTGLRNALFKGSGVGGQYGIIMNGGNWSAQNNGSADLAGQALSANTRYSLAVTLDGTTQATYTNGQLNNSGARSTASLAQNLTLGADAVNSRYWAGLIDYAFICNRALSAADVAKLHADPFRMFRRRRVPVPLKASAAVAPVATVTPETYVIPVRRTTFNVPLRNPTVEIPVRPTTFTLAER